MRRSEDVVFTELIRAITASGKPDSKKLVMDFKSELQNRLVTFHFEPE